VKFRENFKLKKEYENNPYWQAAYEYACENKLYPNEINIVGEAIESRKDNPDD
jgi:hypothetical protein